MIRDCEERPKPKLFCDPRKVTLNRGEYLVPVSIEISPEGVYAGNGEYQDPGDQIFPLKGFDRTLGRERWEGIGYIVTTEE